MLKGEKSAIIGTIGDFEIGAKWHWKINLQTISVCLLAVSVALLLFLAAGFIQLGMQFAELSKARMEIQEAKTEILKIQSEMQDELRRLREESELISYGNETVTDGDSRAKRSIANKPNSGRKSKDLKSPKHKKQNATADKSSSVSKQQHLNHSHVSGVHLERDISYFNTGASGIFIRWQTQPWAPPFAEAVQLEDENSSLVVQTTGLYFIYAQLCYASTKENNSFEVRLMSQGISSQAHSKIIAQCSAGSSMLGNDVTCYTSIAQVLQAGDRLFLQQMEKNRAVLMSNGRSFWGVIKLAN